MQPRSQGRSRLQAAGRARANRPGHSRDCARPGLYSRVIMKRPKRAGSLSCRRGAAIAVFPASATAALDSAVRLSVPAQAGQRRDRSRWCVVVLPVSEPIQEKILSQAIGRYACPKAGTFQAFGLFSGQSGADCTHVLLPPSVLPCRRFLGHGSSSRSESFSLPHIVSPTWPKYKMLRQDS